MPDRMLPTSQAAPNPTLRIATALSRRGLIAVAAGLLVLMGIVASSVWQAARNAGALERVNATVATGALVRRLALAVDDCETGQRGYLLTGQEAYLAPYIQAQARLPALLDAVDARLPGDPALPVLRQTIDTKMAELARTIALARAADGAGALAIVLTNAGREAMVHIRQITAALTAREQAELAGESASIQAGGRVLVAIDLAGLLVLVAITVTIGAGLRRYLAELAAARAAADAAYDLLARSNDHLDETVRVRTADLLAANEEIQRFAYIVSHDLRAPLVNIMGFTGELEHATDTLVDFARRDQGAEAWPATVTEAVTDDIPEALRFIKASTSKMDRLIIAILKLSREGRRALAADRLDMAVLLEEMVASMRHQAKSKDVTVTIGAMPTVYADRLATEQIFSNVIDNALKYLKPGRPGEVRITACSEGPMIRFEVADNGRGIAARDFERVFELFRRAGDQSVPGEGIGLAYVRTLVRRLGGSIDCASTLDVGTRFMITLPEQGSVSQESAA